MTEYLIESLISMNSDPLLFWKGSTLKYPHLSKVANQYLSVTATSAPVERIIIAGKLFRPDRRNLKDKCFENLMFVKCNYVHV